jgi:hypothetical protein
MINIFWSVLNRSVTCSSGRQVSEEAYKSVDKYTTLHNLLVPPSDIIFSSCCAEQILQAVLNSSYKDRLMTLDTLNTYEFSLPFPMNIATTTVTTSPVSVTVLKDGNSFTWVSKEFNVAVDPTALTATVSGMGRVRNYSYSVTDNLSSKIPLDTGLYLRMAGPFPGSGFNINVRCEVPFTRQLTSILPAPELVAWYNAEYRRLYMAEVNPVEKIAILAFNLYEGIANA